MRVRERRRVSHSALHHGPLCTMCTCKAVRARTLRRQLLDPAILAVHARIRTGRHRQSSWTMRRGPCCCPSPGRPAPLRAGGAMHASRCRCSPHGSSVARVRCSRSSRPRAACRLGALTRRRVELDARVGDRVCKRALLALVHVLEHVHREVLRRHVGPQKLVDRHLVLVGEGGVEPGAAAVARQVARLRAASKRSACARRVRIV